MGERTADGGPTAVDWGWLAVSLPGWRWMPGMLTEDGRVREVEYDDGQELVYVGARHRHEPLGRPLPDLDDPATAGCLLALLGGQVSARRRGQWVVEWRGMAPLAPGLGSVSRSVVGTGSTLGRACIAAAETLGRWPGPA
jgi:hypothetical protein